MISQELINELRIIIKEDYGVELQPAVVNDIAYTLVGFFETLAQIAYENKLVIPLSKNSITDSRKTQKGGDDSDDQKSCQ